MKNPFKHTLDNKRYHTWNYFLQKKFGCKVFKVSLNAGFTCPNIDGTKGYGGCTYCSNKGSGDFAGNPKDDILNQFENVKQKMHEKWPNAKYIPYFQAFTNTYAPVEVLKEKFETVINLPNVVGLSVATRADCLPDEVIEYLSDLNKRTFLIVELGLQTIHNKTGELINRCHTYEDFLEAYYKLKKHNINICVHIINGLPNENKEMMLETAKEISKLDIFAVKIHLLHILENTVMANQLKNGIFKLLELQEYVDIVCEQLEFFSPSVIIQRVTGDGEKESLIGPLWSFKKFVVMNEIDKTMVKNNSFQGKKYQV